MGELIPRAVGRLSERPFDHLVAYIGRHRLSGTLVLLAEPTLPTPLTAAAVEAGEQIQFRAGQPVAVSILRAGGDTPADQLISLCGLRQGSFAFFEAPLPASERHAAAVHLDAWELLARGVRAHPDAPQIGALVGRFIDEFLRIRGDARLERFAFDADEQRFVNRLRTEPCTTRDALRQSARPDLARRCVYLLLVTHSTERHRQSGELPRRFDEATAVSAAPPAPHGEPDRKRPSIPSGALAQHNQPGPPPANTTSTPPQNIPVLRGTVQAPGVAAHSPSAAQASRSAVQPRTPRNMPTAKTPTHTGFEHRAHPGAATSGQATRRPAHREDTTQPIVCPVLPLSPAQQQIWDTLLSQAARIEHQDHYRLLDMKPDASTVAIADSIQALRKCIAPHQLPSELDTLCPLARRIDAYLQHVQTTLCDPELRARYDNAQAKTAPCGRETDGNVATDAVSAESTTTVLRREVARALALHKADTLTRNGHYQAAAELIEHTLQKTPGGPESAALGIELDWLQARANGSGHEHMLWADRCRELLEQHPGLERAQMLRARLKTARARQPLELDATPAEDDPHVRMTVAGDPRSLDALAQPDQKTPEISNTDEASTTQSSGLLGILRRRKGNSDPPS